MDSFQSRVTGNSSGGASGSALTVGLEFYCLSADRPLSYVWFWSGSGCTSLPSDAGVWKVSTMSAVAHASSPSWSEAAGSGWVSCDMRSLAVTLTAGAHYVVAVGEPNSTDVWLADLPTSAWDPHTSGDLASSLGLMVAPNDAHATGAGQPCYNNSSAWAWPSQANHASQNYGVDVEVGVF